MRKQKKKGRMILSLMLVLFVITSANSLAFAATARATTMKLEKTEGTVRVKTQNGAARKISNGMRLYNGNSVETATDSYAFVSLDSSKAVKLSENAKASLRQNGKKLELLVKKGQLFFNVSTKLKEDESMNIRTSTMVTGIRGTCGIVEAVSAKTSKLYLLEGKVVLGGKSPVTIHGGESAVIHMAQIADERIVVSKMKETEIPVFAVEEVLKDPVLQKKIENNTDLRVEKMEEAFKIAMETDKKEETQTPTKPEVPSQPGDSSGSLQPEKPAEPEKPSEENPPTGDTGNNGDIGDAGETNPPKDDTGDTGNNGDVGDIGDSSDEEESEPPTEPAIPEEPEPGATLTGNLTVGEIETALSGNSVVCMESESSLTLQNNQSITIPKGKTLIVNAVYRESATGGYKTPLHLNETGMLILEPGAVLYVNGNIAGGVIEMQDGSTIYNTGIIDCVSMTASGKSKIINQNIIKLQQAFTKIDDDTQVDYQGSSESVFISNEESTAMPTEAESSGALLAQAESGNSGTSDEISIVQYIYAGYLNTNAASYMNLLSEKQDCTITWYFKKDAVVPEGKEVTLSCLMADFKENKICVEGKLILRNMKEISGYGESVLYMVTGGHLVLDREETKVGISKYKLENRKIDQIAIAVEESSQSNTAELQTLIEWKDIDLYIQTSRDEPLNSIQGTVVDADTAVASNAFVSVPDGYELSWKDQGLCLAKKVADLSMP